MGESVTSATETKEREDGVSNESLIQTRIEFQPAIKNSPVFNNGVGSLPLQTLNSNLNYSQQSKINGHAFSSMGRNENGEVFENELDQELNLRFTFRKIGAGLANLGNTCFLNSVLQCLTYTEPFTAYLYSGKHTSSCQVAGFCTMCAIEDHVRCAVVSTGRILAPTYLVMNIRHIKRVTWDQFKMGLCLNLQSAYLKYLTHGFISISRNFHRARQEDAHEYMVNLLESMHKCCLPLGLPSESPGAYEKSLVHKVFGGRLRSQVKCMECSHDSNTYDPFLDLSLEIGKADSLIKALANFTAMEELDGGEKHYQCQQCEQKVMAVRQLTIHKPPYVLAIHLKRFGSLIPGIKIDKKVKFCPTLDLKPFVTGTNEGDFKYTLYGVLVHAGWSTHSGHYYCFVRTSRGKWYYLDDDEVFEVNEEDVLQQKAYMLFYVRNRRNFAPKKSVDIVLKQNSVVNNVKSKECSDFVLKYKGTHQTGMLMAGSSDPVFSPRHTKGDAVFSQSMQEKSLSSLKTNGFLIEDSTIAIDFVESSLKLSNGSSQHSINNHSQGESFPQTSSLIVEGSVPISHPCAGVETKVIDKHEEVKATKNDTKEQTLPQLAYLHVKNGDYSSHLNGLKPKAINEHEETIEDLTIPLSDNNGLQECAYKISSKALRHENVAINEMGMRKARSESQHDLIVSLSTLSGCNISQEASKTSTTYMELENVSINEMGVSKTPSESLLHIASSAVEGDNAFNGIETRTRNLFVETKPTKNYPMEETLPHINSSDVEGGGIVSQHFGSKAINEHEETMNDLTVPVSTLTDDNFLHVFALKISARDMEHENTYVNEMVQSKEEPESLPQTTSSVLENDATISHPYGASIIDETTSIYECEKDKSENEETIKESNIPFDILPNSNILQESSPKASAIDLEHERVSFNEKAPSKAICEKTNELRCTKVDSVQLSSQLGVDATLCKKVGDVVPKEGDSLFLSSQSSTEETTLCKGIGNFGSRGIDPNQLSDQLNNEDMLCKRMRDLGPKEVVSLPLSSQQGSDDGQNDCILNERSSNELMYEEEFGPRSEEINCVPTLSKSKKLSKDKLAFDQLHCQKVLKPQKNQMKFRVARMNHRSSLLLRRSLCVRRKKKHKKSRKQSLEHEKSTPKYFGEESVSGHLQQDMSSVYNFMSMLTRGIEETTVARWNEISSHPPEIPELSKSPNLDYVSNDWDVEYDCGKRKKLRSSKNGSVESNHFQEIKAKKIRLKKAKMDQSSSGNLPFRI